MTQHNNFPSHPLIDQWLTELHHQGRTQHTLAAYRRGLAHFTQWSCTAYGGSFDPVAIIPRDVRDWKAHQQTVEKASPATINQRLVALSQFFTWAVRHKHLPGDPTAEVRTLPLAQRQPKSLSHIDLRRLLRAVHAGGILRDIAVIEVLVGTGLRVGELLALQIGDLQIGDRSGKLTVRRGNVSHVRPSASFGE